MQGFYKQFKFALVERVSRRLVYFLSFIRRGSVSIGIPLKYRDQTIVWNFPALCSSWVLKIIVLIVNEIMGFELLKNPILRWNICSMLPAFQQYQIWSIYSKYKILSLFVGIQFETSSVLDNNLILRSNSENDQHNLLSSFLFIIIDLLLFKTRCIVKKKSIVKWCMR